MSEQNPYPPNVVALPAGSSSIDVFQFFVENLVVQVTVLKESCWVYVGHHDRPLFENLTLTMNDAKSALVGMSEEGSRIAQHVQKRFKLGACFVSFNGSPDEAAAAERALMTELVARKTFVV
jgi:hypothetical protein